MICCPLIGYISLASTWLSWWKSLYIDVLVSSHGGVGIALFLHGDSTSLHQGVNVGCCSCLVFPWHVETLLLMCALLIGRFHLSLFVCLWFLCVLHGIAWACMRFHVLFILISSWYFCLTLHVEGWTCMVPRICMVFHLIWLGGSFWLAMVHSLDVMMKGLCMHLHVALFAW
jgi:hypothetical protein